MPPLQPATLAFRNDGTPYSAQFDDIYHSAAGGVGQAQQVFLAGSDLPARWARRPVFAIVETGFGLGLNFLATWAAWRADPERCERLHVVSIEKHPFSAADLRAILAKTCAEPALANLAVQLCDAWPQLVPGLHRLEFEHGAVNLTLAFGAIADLLPKLWLRADAFYLDGFAPDKNPDMWAPGTLKALTRIAGQDATVATYTVAGTVKQALRAAGFEIRRANGYGGKYHRLTGRFAPPWRMRRYEPPAPPSWPEQHALVIGAGLAGCALTERLAARGWRVTLIEQRARHADAASGNPAAIFHPLLTRDDSVAARITRAGFLYALRHWATLTAADHAPLRSSNGLLQIAADASEAAAMAATLAQLGYPAAFARAVSQTDAALLAGVTPAAGGYFFPEGGSIDPAAVCTAQLARAGAQVRHHFGVTVQGLARRNGHWHALAADGRTLARAPVVIVANANDAARVAGLRFAPTHSVRGQLTMLPEHACDALRMPVMGDGYLVPLAHGRVLSGASYDLGDLDPALRHDSQIDNLTRLGRLIPELATRFDAIAPTGRVAFRCVASDRLPLIGQLADEAAACARANELAGAWPRDLPRQAGLYGAFGFGSRGLVWAALGAELLAAQIHGEPWPLERDLADSLDPARFLLRALRHQDTD